MSLEQEQSIQETITGIVPYWVGMEGETETVMWLPEVVVYSSHAGDFPTARTVCIDMSGDFEAKPTEGQLRTAAQKYITDNNIGVPVVGFDISFATLAQTTEYASIALLERIDLCDFVTVIFPDFGISAQAKVVETYFDNLRERYTQIRIGDQRFTLADQIAQQSQDIVDSEAKQTNSYLQALEQATALINGDLTGASMITQTDDDGNPVGLIFMDTNDPATAVNCIRINSNGIGFSNNGVNGPYSSTWGIDNTFNAANIYVINLSASSMTTGIITDRTGTNYWNLDTGDISIQATVNVGIGARNYIRKSNTLNFADYYWADEYEYNGEQAQYNGEDAEVGYYG
jgi:phage-related protein